MYLPYQISNYHPKKVLDMDLSKTEIKTMSCDMSSYATLTMQKMYKLFDRIFFLISLKFMV